MIITVGGMLLTYLLSKDETFLWRLAAGNIVGSAVFGIVCFLIANFFGLSAASIAVSLIVLSCSLFLLKSRAIKRSLKDDWQRAKDRTQGGNIRKFASFGYYLFFFALFLAFFDRAMIIGNDGIFTGASQNLGDLPFHLGAIFSFTDGNNFPPQNPSFADAKFTYPFIADFLTACLHKLGADVRSAMLVQNVVWAFSLLVILESFAGKIVQNKLAGKIAPLLLFFSGGLGFLWFFKDYWSGAESIFGILWNLPRDYTIGNNFRWGNSLVVLFITQRSLLLGMPLAIIVIGKVWELFTGGETNGSILSADPANSGQKNSQFVNLLTPFFVGLLAGTLPLIHAHSLAVLFVVSGFWFFFSLDRWKARLAFAVGVMVIALPELFWILSGSATHTSEFVGWHFGWDAREDNIFWFWIKNTGIFIPVLITAAVLRYFPQRRKGVKEKQGKDKRNGSTASVKSKMDSGSASRGIINYPLSTIHLIFLLPFLFLFLISNVAKFAPWEWDNIKILIYCFVGALPIAAMFLAWIWQKGGAYKFVSAGLFLILTLAGALDVWRTASAQMRFQVFDADAVDVAEAIKLRTPPNALFLNAPTYNSAVALSGRRSLMRYTGHLSSHGIDYKEREADLKTIYSGAGTAELFIKKYGIEYVLISPKEREMLQVNDLFFNKFPVVYEVGEYKIYKVND
ncbi:MAG: hypothetical protein KDB79_15480 [Acidobacteria bacterium]|nr:hypothetical protein [Acidobacteriota bacterium]